MAETRDEITPYPGAERLEQFLDDQKDQLGYPEARLIFGSRPWDTQDYHPDIKRIIEAHHAAGMMGVVQFKHGGPAVIPTPDELTRLRTPIEAIMSRADAVFRNNIDVLQYETGPLQRLHLRSGDLMEKLEGQEGEPLTLRRMLETRVLTLLAQAGRPSSDFSRVMLLEGGGQTDFMPLEYGELALPEFSDAQTHLRLVELSYKEMVNELKQGDALQQINQSRGSVALNAIEKAVAAYVVRKVTESEIGDPTLVEHASNAVSIKQWEGVEEGSPEKFVLSELIARNNRLTFELTQEWLEASPETGLTRVGELEYQHVLPLMAVTDRWFLKLYAEEFPIDSDERARRGMKNECAVVRTVDGTIKEVPFHEAYPEEIDALGKGYRGVVRSLVRLRIQLDSTEQTTETTSLLDLIERKIQYYTAVATAYETSDFDDWMKAEALLAGQVRDGNDTFHVHAIEIAYMKDRILRAPETSLRVPDLSEPEAQALSARTKQRMVASFEADHFADAPGVGETLVLLKGSNATVRHFTGSGQEMHLKAAGQILPNEFNPRMQGGVDSSLDVGSARQRLPAREKAGRRIFGDAQWDTHFAPRMDLTEKVGRMTASHELGHALGLTATTRERLNIATLANPFIEEWKATVGGMLGEFYIPYLEAQKANSPDAETEYEGLVRWMTDKLGEACRYAGARHSDFGKGYFRKSMMMMKVAEEMGILEHTKEDTENPWHVNLDRERILAFCERLMVQFKQVINIYREGSEADLQGYLTENLQVTPFTQFLCDRIEDNAHSPENTPEGLVALPVAA